MMLFRKANSIVGIPCLQTIFDILVNSTMGRDIRGREMLKGWAAQFVNALQSRVDLVDEFEAIDADGNGRAFFTVCLNWEHAEEFMGLQPTGREGTSIETMLSTIKDDKVVRWDVADNTVVIDLYFWERGWAIPHNVHPEILEKGIERRLVAA
jgi:predicted ester cyclase